VSHAPERTEKNCLNCGTNVMGRFCHVCGQENIVPKESFGNLVLHFFYDITHFDGKFFDSLRYLLFRPGFLSKEYIKGKRAAYLNPVRMYVFTSAIFFIIFFMVVDPREWTHGNEGKILDNRERSVLIDELKGEYKKGEKDTAILLKKMERLKDTSQPVTILMLNQLEESDSSNKEPKTFAEYEAAQKAKPESERDGWLQRMITKKIIYREEFRTNPSAALEKWVEVFLHNLPYLLFISLPFFALVLKLLYLRRRKEFYYADHAIFSIHHYILSFILLLVSFLFGTIYDLTGMLLFRILLIILLCIWPIHLYIAMLNFYKQRWFKTFVKFFLLNLLGFFIIMVLFGVFLMVSLIQL
jgi:hypothetical protein